MKHTPALPTSEPARLLRVEEEARLPDEEGCRPERAQGNSVSAHCSDIHLAACIQVRFSIGGRCFLASLPRELPLFSA